MFLTKAFLKKNVVLLLVMMILLLVVAACGSAAAPAPQAEKPAEKPAEAAAPAEKPAEAAQAEAPAAEAKEVTLTFWTFVDAHADYYLAQVERFNAEHSDLKIKLEPTVFPYNEMHDKLLIAFQSGTGAPDLADVEIAKFGTFLRGDIQFQDLSPIVDKYRKDLVETRLAPYEIGGKPYGIDTHLGAFVIYYNKELLDKAGVDVDSIKTWDDYIEAGKQVKEKTGAWMTTVESTGRFTVLGLMLQNGGGTYDKDGNFILDSPANVEALQLASDMVHVHKIATIAQGGDHHQPSYYEFMNQGKSASVWMPQWYMIRFKEFMPDLKGKMVVRPMPAFKEGGFISTMGGGTGTTITKQIDPTKVDAAMQFLEFSKLTYEAQVQIWTVFGFDPFRLDVYDDPELKKPDEYFSNEPVMQNIKAMLDRLAPEYTGPRYPETMNILNEKVAFGLFDENKAPAEILSASAKEINALQ